ncbi:MAG: hypothetical protein KAW47_04730 [Thermoplasmatales archaeon]|nr:hypothetical protein [Thermoplasmatales archaeon]
MAKFVKARKQHICDGCKKPILPKTKYLLDKNVAEAWWTFSGFIYTRQRFHSYKCLSLFMDNEDLAQKLFDQVEKEYNLIFTTRAVQATREETPWYDEANLVPEKELCFE